MTAAETTPILLIGDHSVSVTSLEMALRASGFTSVTVVDADLAIAAALAAARSLPPGVALVDVRARGGQLAVELVNPLVVRGCKVLLFAASDNPGLIAAGLRAGAEAIVDRAMSFQDLLATIVELAGGRQLIPRDEREALLEALQGHNGTAADRRHLFDALTAREAHVLRCLVDGTSPKQIAYAEGLSIFTVRGHIERIFTKLGVRSQREALALARAVGWPDTLASTTETRTGNFPP